MNYLIEQINDAKDNYNYFFVKLIFGILKIFFKLAIVLVVCGIFDYMIINIIGLLFSIYSCYRMVFVYRYYINIINDIMNTLGMDKLIFVIDFKLIRLDLFRGVLRYGK